MAVKYCGDRRVYRGQKEQGILKSIFLSLETGTPGFFTLMTAVICSTYFLFPSAKWLQRWVCPEGKVTS